MGVFDKKYFVTKKEFKNWAWRDPNVFREVFKRSPSKRREILEKLEKYWPDSWGSLTKTKLYILKRRLQRNKYFGTFNERKEAGDLLKLIEAFEKNFSS